MIVVLDSRDSFVHNLARYLVGEGAEVRVIRSDEPTPCQILALEPRAIVLSPGPCTPTEAGVGVELVQTLLARPAGERSIPVLGVCLGHQVVGVAAGARLRAARPPRHGVRTTVRQVGEPRLFTGLPRDFPAGLYHSLSIDPETLPGTLQVIATDTQGEIMAIQHRDRPVHGVQFHPESILTPDGRRILRNFLRQTSRAEATTSEPSR